MQDPDKYLVRALVKKIRYVELKRGISVCPAAGFPAVDENRRVEVHAVEIQQHPAGKHF